MVQGVSSNYGVYQKPGYTTKWQPSEDVQARVAARRGRVSQTQPSVSESGNLCTDGKDDGKIGFFSAIGNIFEGAGKALVKGVKGMFTDSEGKFSLLKTLKTVAIGAACVVCPAAGFALGAVGLATGAVKLGSGVVKALGAKTDAEAKDMWEQVGEGGLTVAASVAGMKASLGAMKAAAGPESALATLKSNPNATFMDKVSAFGKDAVASTRNNVTNLRYSLSNFFERTKDIGKAKGALREAKSVLKKTAEGDTAARIQAETDLSYAQADLANAQEAWTNTNVGRILTDTKNTVFHPFKTFKALRESLRSNPAAATEATAEAASATASKFKFGNLTSKIKSVPSNLSSTARTIWTKLCDPNTTYSQIVSEYGYTNVAEVLGIMADYGLVDNAM